MNERINQLVFRMLNPITPPAARRWIVIRVFDGPRIWWVPLWLSPALVGLGLGSMPRRVK